MAGGGSSNKSLVPIIAVGAVLALGAGAWLMFGGAEEPVDDVVRPQQPAPQQVSQPKRNEPAKKATGRTRTRGRDSRAASDQPTRSRGPAQTEASSKKKDAKKRKKTKKKKDKTPKTPPAVFREPGVG